MADTAIGTAAGIATDTATDTAADTAIDTAAGTVTDTVADTAADTDRHRQTQTDRATDNDSTIRKADGVQAMQTTRKRYAIRRTHGISEDSAPDSTGKIYKQVYRHMQCKQARNNCHTIRRTRRDT